MCCEIVIDWLCCFFLAEEDCRNLWLCVCVVFFFFGKGWLWIEFENAIAFDAWESLSILDIFFDKEKEGDKWHIMHYKLVVGVLACLGQWVTKIKRQNDKDKKTKIKKQNEIKNTIYMWHKFIKIKLSMFD